MAVCKWNLPRYFLLLVSSCGGVAEAEGINALEKACGVGPHAEIFAQFFVFAARRFGHQVKNSLFAWPPGTRVRHRVVDHDSPLQVLAVDAAESLFEAHLVTVHIAVGIEPGALVETI